MKYSTRSAFLHLIALPFAVAMVTSACTKWVPIHSSPPIAREVESANVLRVHLVGGQVIDLEHDTRLVGDSLIGYRQRPHTFRRDPIGRTAVALGDIERLEERRGDSAKTSAVFLGIILMGCAVDGEEAGYGCPF